jgi:putative tryptophan/tyrosine transport system substrate-binding protein
MNRRQFIALSGLGIAAWSHASDVEAGERLKRVVVLVPTPDTDPDGQGSVAALRKGLEQRGWIIGDNLRLEPRWRIQTVENAKSALDEILPLAPDVVIASTSQTVKALLQASSKIPVVFIYIYEPVTQGFVQSFAHPGGNATGFSSMEASIGAKWLELLRQLAPDVARVAFLSNPENPGPRQTYSAVKQAASGLGIEAIDSQVRTAADIEAAMSQLGPHGGLIVPPDGLLTGQRGVIIELAERYRLPAMYGLPVFVKEGGLASYGASYITQSEQAANYVDRILRGENPGDLPVQQPTEFDLAINLKTAKKLGLSVAPSLLISARDVIE